MGHADELSACPCPRCGANLRLVGRTHRCVPAKVTAEVANKPEDMANTMPDMANSMANTYRYRDADQRRAYMRAYMAKRRARHP